LCYAALATNYLPFVVLVNFKPYDDMSIIFDFLRDLDVFRVGRNGSGDVLNQFLH